MRTMLCLAGIVLLQGCGANFHSIYREDNVHGVQVRTVDAKQRFLFAGVDKAGRTIVCPEPSPDALSATGLASELSAQKLGGIAGLGMGAATGESAASIGLRTQTISLLRDQMTHLCLLRLAQVFDEKAYDEQLRRLQISALGMLAIEQLTGATRASTVAVSVQAGVSRTPGNANEEKPGTSPAIGTLNVIPGKPEIDSPDQQRGNTQDIAQAVVAILDRVYSIGYPTVDECRDYFATAIADAPAGQPIPPSSKCAKAAAAPGQGPDQVISGILELPVLDRAQVQAFANNLTISTQKDISKSTKAAIDDLPSASTDYQGYAIDFFVCKRASTEYVRKIDRHARLTVEPRTLGRVRVQQLEDDRFKRRSGGLDPDKPVATVFTDGDQTGETEVAKRVVADLQQANELTVADIQIKPNVAVRGQAPTPFYVSVWLCP